MIHPSCTNKSEVESYKSFILSFNHALRAIAKIDVPLLRRLTNPRLLFHQNDPKYITMTHSGRTSRCKPDVALVSLSEAQAASGDDKCKWACLAFEIATKSLQKDFQWRSVLSAAEFKWTKDLSSPPTEYTLELEVIEPPKFSSVGEIKDLPAQEVTQSSVGTKPKLSNPPSSIREEVTQLSIRVMLRPSNAQVAISCHLRRPNGL